MIQKVVIALVGFFSLLGFLWHLGYFGDRAEPTSPVSPLDENVSVPTAVAWGIFDVESGAILEGKMYREALPIASITKLFTAYAAYASDSLDRETWIFLRDIYTEGRAGKLHHGEHLTVRDLLFPLLIESSNDAGTAIDGVLLHERTEQIDALLRKLELTHTHIVDATGLSPQNVSSVEELSLFFSYLYREYPYITDITTLRMYIDDERGLINNDPARKRQGFRGGKHGYLPEAGRTFVGVFEQADGTKIGLVFLQSSDILKDVDTLLRYAKKF